MNNKNNEKYNFIYNSPIGKLLIIHSIKEIIGIKFISSEKDVDKINVISYDIIDSSNLEKFPIVKETIKQLDEYFLGKREVFSLPLKLIGTDFQISVWNELQRIPFGETKTYKEIAENINNPKACRAVGLANNKNPIPIIVPCHRVIGSNGKLVGFAGGLGVKEKLLELEKNNCKTINSREIKMIACCGNEKDSDALVTVNLDNKGVQIEIISKLKDMFGEQMASSVKEVLSEMKIENAKVTVKDYGALDFVIKARTKIAIERALELKLK